MKYPHIMQHDEKDCGAACLSMISEYYGLKLPVTKCRDLIKVDNFGANIYGIITGASEIGFNAEALEGNADELSEAIEKNEVKFPFIARIINEEHFEHFIVVYAIKNDKVYIGDPAKVQTEKISFEKFLSQWQEQIIAFSTNETFVKGNERKGALNKFFKLIFNQKKILALVFVLSLLISGISIFSASIFEYIIDDAVTMGDVSGELSEDEHTHEDEHEESEIQEEELTKTEYFLMKSKQKFSDIFKNLETVCISIICLYFLQAVLKLFRGYVLAVMSKNIDIPISLGYYKHLIDLPVNFFGTRKTGELMSRFSDASNIQDAVSTTTLTIMLDTLMAIIIGLYLCILNYKLFLITMAIIIIYAVIIFSFRKPIKIINQSIMEENAQITSYLKESIDGIETIKAYEYEEVSKNKTSSLFVKLANKIVHSSVVYNLQDVIVGLIQSVGLVCLLWLGTYLCIENIITIGSLITFYFLLDYFLEPVKNLIELQPTIQTAVVAAERLNDILDMKIEDNSKKEADNLKGDIEFKNIDFRYGNRKLVLKNVSMKIPSGSKIAIVGTSGCGKTTLVKLLMNFYNSEKGTITVNKKVISEYSPKSIRRHIAYISQNTFLFSDSIYNNLRMGNNLITDEEIENMCRLCLADQFIQELPFGYNTILEEDGNNLSGGQKQRLAIIRALLRNPDILIMDEATSNLDTITEELIHEIIDKLPESITVIIIAHRLRTIHNCDYIYVMNKGTIEEEGTHDCLMRKGGLYSDYYQGIG